MGDYIDDMTLHAKTEIDRSNGASRQIGEISLSRSF